MLPAKKQVSQKAQWDEKGKGVVAGRGWAIPSGRRPGGRGGNKKSRELARVLKRWKKSLQWGVYFASRRGDPVGRSKEGGWWGRG